MSIANIRAFAMVDPLTALTSDYLNFRGVPVAGAIGEIGKSVLAVILKKRVEEARDILLDELAKGRTSTNDIPQDEAAAAVFRYMRAAEEGAARLNLKLMAAVIAGQRPEASFYANNFLFWAGILSSLRREEVLILGVMHRIAASREYKLSRTGDYWKECLDVLEMEYSMNRATADAMGAALMRTGLVTILGGLMDIGHAYMPGPSLSELAEMADLETYYMETPYGFSP